MSPLGVTLFTIATINTIVLIGNYYIFLKINKTIWLVITVISIIAFAICYIRDSFFSNSEEERQ
jgi:hypothetical protein